MAVGLKICFMGLLQLKNQADWSEAVHFLGDGMRNYHWVSGGCGIFLFGVICSAQAGTLVGSLPGQFGVSGGEATYSIPLDLPPGLGKAVPQLSLSYSSDMPAGVMGVGWHIGGMSAIARCPQTLAVDGQNKPLALDSSDKFCLDGRRLILVSGTYGAAGSAYRTEIEDFSRVSIYNGGFKVETKGGQVLEYGTTSDSLLLANASGHTSIPLKWALAKSYDAMGHLMTFSYATSQSTGEQYFSKISYAYNAAQTQNLVDVVYTYATNTTTSTTTAAGFPVPPITAYFAGNQVTRTKLLSSISVQQAPSMGAAKAEVRNYQITYGIAPSTNRQRVTSIQSCFPTGNCIPATSFGWSNYSVPGFQDRTQWNDSFGTDGGWTDSTTFPRYAVDVTGDGLPDLVGFHTDGVMVAKNLGFKFDTYTPWNTSFGFGANSGSWTDNNKFPRYLADVDGDGLPDIVGFGYDGTFVAINNGNGFNTNSMWIPSFGVSTNAGSWTDNIKLPRYVVDMDGDGMPDIVGFGYDGIFVAHNNGSGFDPVSKWTPSFGYNAGSGSWTDSNVLPRVIVDINGDGLPDVVGFGYDGVFVALNTGSGFGPTNMWIASFAPNAGGWTDNKTNPRYVTDVNGDGLPDIVGFGNDYVFVSLNTGTGFGPVQSWLHGLTPNAGGWTDNNVNPRYIEDVNGDGLPDIVGFGNDNVYVAINTGTSFSTPAVWTTGFTVNGGGWTDVGKYPREIIDVNGDGVPDILGFGNATKVGLSSQTQGIPDLMTSVTNPLNASYTINYTPLTNAAVYVKGSGASIPANGQIDQINNQYVVSSVATSNGVGGLNTTQYKYGSLKADLKRGSLGFGWTESLDMSTRRRVHSDYMQGFPFTGMAGGQQLSFCNVSVPTFDTACDKLEDSTNTVIESLTYGSTQSLPSQKVHFVYVQSSTVNSYEPPTPQQ